MPLVLKNDTSATRISKPRIQSKRIQRADHYLAGISALAFGASLMMPQPVKADTTITNSIVATTQTVSGNFGQITVTGTGTINAATAGILVASAAGTVTAGTISTLDNAGKIYGATRGIFINYNGQIGTITNSGLIAAGPSGAFAAGGIANAGTIGTIANTGTITSSHSSGIGNNQTAGSIGLLTNSGVISGVTGGIWNQGTFGQIVNSGTITGTEAGIYMPSGTIGTLDNSGRMAGGIFGISISSGTLGTLLNSGTLTAPTALYFGSGAVVGGIADSGVIAGNITNLRASVLTITGGSGSTIGTLTGVSGKGTITNTASNLLFASGNLLLNDNIVATGRTVTNGGASLTLNSIINVTGAFSQTSGTLTIDPTQGGLIASGAVAVSGGTIVTEFASTGNYITGNRTLVGGSSLNLSGATVAIGSLTGLYTSTSTAGNALQLSIINDYIGGTLASLANSAAITGASTGLYVAATGSIGTMTNSGTLGGAHFGVNSNGIIGTFSNTGQITSNGSTALWNQGSIGQLSNSGTITNGSWAIRNDSTIGTLTNSGVISGTGNAIQNYGAMALIDNSGTMSGGSNALAGDFGTLVNSGVIRGDINRDGGSIGTIIGGSGGSVGTFTGFDGTSQGTLGINSNLKFASGSVLLNDTILAKSVTPSAVTVSNTGASIALTSTVTIDAGFTQSAGTLDLGSTGKLVVSQAAAFSGGTISVNTGGLSSTSTYLVGDAVGGTLVTGGSGSSYSGVSIVTTGGLTGLSAAATTLGNNLLLAAGNIYVGDTQAAITNSGSISGVSYPLYVANTGSVGALSNTGTLSGTVDGLNNNGSIGTLNNTGRIVGAQKGLGNQSTITALNNAAGGTILGGTAAGLQNDTSLGTLTNAGYISSNSAGVANYGTMGGLSNSGTITGGPQAIYNSGVVTGTIANSGTITAPQSAIGLSGSVAALTNSGVIGNGTNGINLGGDLGTLINQAGGTISAVSALYVSGSLGGLSNSGLIKGGIRNDSTNDLTITGGSAGTIGTLTGASGKGTITNTLSNLRFASGNLLLNDNIVATGHTVTNAGASLSLNSIISVTGAFSQTSGTLTIDPLQAGLNVSGAATFSGGTIAASLSSIGNYTQGSHTLVSASSLNLSGATVSINSVTGLYKSTSTVGNKLQLSITNDYVGGTLASLANSAAITSASTGLYVATTGSIGTMTNSGTLGGVQFGVNNRGSIGTFANSGLITDNNFTALWNQGSIGQLTNSGTISNNSWAILNTGTIGTVTNTGVISGAGVGIRNIAVINVVNNSGTLSGGSVLFGTFGTLINSGLIKGNINPSGGVIGTIIGGSGGWVGTFTGANGTSQGTIGAGGNLTFASGSVLLNDTIKAAGIAASALTVSNTGASIALTNTVTIDANFAQSAGTLNLGTTGKLVVTQAANFSGGTIAANLGGLSTTANYLAGSAVGGTLVSGGTGSSYSGVSIVATGGISGLAVTTGTSGTNLLVSAQNNYIGGSLATLSNTGSLSADTAVYAASTGSLGALSNSGTLAGSMAAIHNAGTLGPITNTGVIAGNIDNLSAQALSITGGTLTGFAANSQGTITSTLGNVVLGGTIALNDAFNVGSQTVVNDGGSLSLASIVSVTGNFSQSSGVLTLGSGAMLDVSGAAVFSGGTIATAASGTGNYLVGGSGGTLVHGGAGSSYTDVTVDSGGQPGLAQGGQVVGNDLVVAYLNNYIGGSLATLSNTGSLSAATAVYVATTGSLGALSNSGTLAGSVAAIHNEGTLGPITNTGVIAGDIVNLSAQDLHITGGTLTGFAANTQGTISNTLGNVVLGGTIALNDAFNVGSHTVVNDGGALTLAQTVNVTGNFSQSSGRVTLQDGAQLVVSGTASLTGGTIATSVTSGANYLAGSAVGTLVVGGTGSTYSGVTVDTGAVTGLALQSGASGTNLVATALNNYIGGSLATLSNTGSLSAATAVYVATTGSLGALSNSGTLSGSVAAIHNAGALGPITNTGVIAGDIVNLSAQDLHITGGTLTGFAANTQGTISNTLGNVVLGGTIALNDAFNVGSHTVVNDGGTLTLAQTVNVTGNFSQSGGRVTLQDGAQLVVSGTASLTGGTIATSVASGANYLAGSAVGTLVVGGTGSTYSGVTVDTGAVTGLALQSGASGTNLVATALNNYIGGNLATLSNTGSLSAATAVYVASTGSLGALSNSGTLAGSVAAIHNAGALGPISNTGVIAGDVYSTAAADMAIAGGSGDTFGTLTGYAADSQGLITNTGGNLLLTGNIAFNDAVNVGSHAVSVNGGTLAINRPVAITGNYNQTGGKLLIGVTSTQAYGQLQVSGSASLTGTNVTLVKLGTATIASGQSYAVVKANGALTYSNLTASVTGLTGAFSTASSGGATELVLTLSETGGGGTITPPPPEPTPVLFAPTGLQAGGPGVGTGAALDAIADSGGTAAAPVIANVLLPLAVLPNDQQQRAIVQLSPTQLTPQVIAVAVSPAVNAIVQHQDVLAANATGRVERGLSAGSQGSKGAIWGQFLVSAAKRANRSAASPYKANSYGVMVGADLIGTASLAGGVALSWVNSNAYGRAQVTGSNVTLDSFQATAYFTLHPGGARNTGLAFDGQFGFGYNHYKQQRQIDFLQARADASFNGQQYLANVRASYTVPLSKTASVTPFASLREVHLRNDGYTETGAASANLKVAKLDIDAFSHEIGVQAAGIFGTATGRVAPSLKLGWVHTYSNGAIPLNAVLGGVSFTSTSARGAANGVTLGAGVSFMQSDRFSISAQYDGELRRDFKSHSGTVKLTYKF